MKTTPKHDERIASLTFASVYPHYLTKVEKKGKNKDELHQVITWLTGFDEKQLNMNHSIAKNLTSKSKQNLSWRKTALFLHAVHV